MAADSQPSPYSCYLCLEGVFCGFGLFGGFPSVSLCNTKKKKHDRGGRGRKKMSTKQCNHIGYSHISESR
jgi:hypothetical protein